MKNDYGDLALYKLATLNEKVDDAKSKNYAKNYHKYILSLCTIIPI